MSTRCLPAALPLHSPWPTRLADRLVDLAHEIRRRWSDGAARRAELREARRAEREFERIDLRTLQDIGAPQGLVGQRRWQEEQEAIRVDRLLNQRGW